jgi:cytochrome P450
MTVAASVTLAELEADPHPTLHRLRSESPVAWVPAIGGWLVTSRELAVEVMRDPDTFTVDDPRFSTAQVIGPSMLSTDGPAHDRHRAPFVETYGGRRVDEDMSTEVEAEALRLVTEIRPTGTAELRTSVAAPLAVTTAVRSLGLSGVGPVQILAWYSAIVETVQAIAAGSTDTSAGSEAFADLSAAVRRSIEARDGSLLAEASLGDLTDGEVASNAAVIMFGGIETSESATAGALLHLLSHPEQLEAVRSDRALLPNAIEESFRLEPAAASVDRYATRATDLGGAAIAEGDYLSVSLAAANRDPEVFTDPDRFDITRPNSRQHATFAYGPHACLGIHLARLETGVALSAVLDLLPRIRLDAAATIGPRGLVFRKPVAVRARWDAV